ncbi:family 8 glycosyl transferase [Streptococcus suis]|uniref:glycosyltransferase n=1 Tax=Streptococcus suis TaxID=1307 RepID=UPI002412991E|nr:glycosyltransferase [Streptococcus suis]MDG4506126.1 family 8 glycosyl transferase [Streptococcus suis]HEM2826628.1 family 8 glycosyl transferase [Streptococcus suis]HEM4402728.1 family 8 glycosyl transferase [Streptococcus suis]
MRKAIVLATDKNYLEKTLVTIKSISVYNRDIDFYIFHQGDVPVEWIRVVNKRLVHLGSSLKHIFISDERVNAFHSFLPSSSWLRLFIPQYVAESKALYLDSDIIVNGSLDTLFAIDLEDKMLAAVEDPNMNEAGNFNSGVLLLNLDLWRRKGLTNILLKVAAIKSSSVRNGDQSILNLVVGNLWIPLEKQYNYQTYDVVSRYDHRAYLYEDIGSWTPLIIHFLTADKPWNEYSVARFRELWWYYASLEFSSLDGRRSQAVSFEEALDALTGPSKHAFLLTETDQLEHIDYLVSNLPDIQFHIAAYTMVSSRLKSLMNYDNVQVYPEIIDARVDKLLDYCDIYLDINHYSEVKGIVSKAREKGKLILAFENTVHHPELASEIFSPKNPEKFLEYLQAMLMIQ